MPNFESFDRRMMSLRSKPQVTIQRRGSLSLNQSSHVALSRSEAVELLFDREAAIIGLRPIDVNADNAYHVRRASRSAAGPWVVSAMAFLKFYDIDTSHTVRHVAYIDDGVLCVDLTATELS